MTNERASKILEQIVSDREYTHPRNPPLDFLRQISTLLDEEAMELAACLFMMQEWRFFWMAVIIFQKHPTARKKIDWKYLKPLGDRLDSWGLVDAFSELAGPAWRCRQISDAQVMSWTRSKSRWWRRAALVCTVFLNRKTRGGTGDTPRTLKVCDALLQDRDDMVVKGMSWALRDLLKRDREAVEDYLREHETELSSLVKREVRSKLNTGRKNPRPKTTT